MSGFRLSPQQRRLWQLGAPGYHAQIALLVPAAADEERVRRALGRVAARHEILRSTFRDRGLTFPLQAAGTTEDVGEVAWRAAGPLDEGGLAALLEAERERPRDLSTGPMLHACLTRLADGSRCLVLTLPALCADRLSLHNLAREVTLLTGDAGPALPGDLLSYFKYAEWQNGLLEEDAAEEGLGYWRGLHLEALPPLALPFTSAPETEAPFAPRAVPVELPAGAVARLDAAARAAGTSAGGLLLAAWQALLCRLTGQPDLVVGVACDGREYEVLAAAVGPIARYLPVPARLDPTMGLGDLARAAHDRLAQGREWQEHFTPEPGGFDALFDFAEPASGAGIVLACSVLSEPFLLRLAAERRGDALAVELGYDSTRVSADSARRFAGSFARLLGDALDRPLAPLGELEALGDGERLELAGWNGTARPAAEPVDVHALFAAAARRSPGRLAVACGGRELTYGELHAGANQVAHRLRRLGIGPGSRVALLFDRSPEMVVAIWGVLGAGAAYVPLDPNLPEERLAALVAGANPALVLRRSLASGPIWDFPTLALDLGGGGWESEPETDLPPLAGGGDPAYVLFTSGSTGAPKGVEVERRQLANYVEGITGILDLPAGSGFAMVSTFAADLGNTVFFPALCGGGRLFVATEEVAADPELLAAAFERFGVDCLKIVPSHLSALLGVPRPERVVPRAVLVLGGEALGWELAARVAALAPGCRVLNHYGPTETTVGVLTFPVEPGRRVPFAAGVPLGRPLPGVQVHLLDAALRGVPAGVPGEICIGGASVARGYLDTPDLTALRFVPHPLASEAGARLYRTGDRARRLPDGAIEFLGRMDRQVKIRGFRVEPGEVEAALRSHPAVRDAVVEVRGDAAPGGPLVAYVVVAGPGGARGGQRLKLPNGLEVFHLNRNETLHLYRQIFEEGIYLRHGIEFVDGGVIFDVGANIGMFSLFAHQACRGPRIYAFEPSPVSFEALRGNVELHGLDARLHQAGVAAAQGTGTFTFYPRVSVMSGFHADPEEEELLFRGYLASQEGLGDHSELLVGQADELVAGRFERQEIACPLTTVSAAVREHGVERIDLLKVDVEKSELEVLSGIAAEDWPRIRQVTVEIHDVEGRARKISDLLVGHGFAVALEQDETLGRTNIVHLYGWRPQEGVAAGARARGAIAGPLPSAAPLTPEALRDFLRGKLPEPMVPGRFVFLPELPLTRNGKVDRSALPDPEVPLVAPPLGVAPRTAGERLLAAIWCEVLGLPEIGVHDNFFELGGDSILTIQVAAKASRAGLPLATRDLFRHQTIADLAAAAAVGRKPAAAAGEPVSGPVPLTPIQHWFFAQDLPDPHHFNQAVLLEVRGVLAAGELAAALAALLEHHDALRLRFHQTADGWRQENAPPDSDVPLHLFDLAALAPAEQAARLAVLADELQASLDLTRGPLVRAGLFDLGPGRPGRLLLVVHHLAVDGVSWRILLADLEEALATAPRGAVELPPRTTSWKTWAERLAALAAAGELDGELPYWLAEPPRLVTPLPRDLPAGANTVAAARVVERALAPAETAVLLQEVPAAYPVQTAEVLLTALALAFREWTGCETLWVDLEGHGREEIADDLDLSRTVGWFTTHFPVSFDLAGARTEEALRRVKERMRRIPRRGLGYGVLRYLAPGGAELSARPDPELKFNYLGQVDRVLSDRSRFGPAEEPTGRARSPRGRRGHLLEVDAVVRDRQLHVAFTYSAGLHRRETLELLADGFVAALRATVSHCLSGQATGYTPSDFPLAELGQDELDEALREIGFEERGSS